MGIIPFVMFDILGEVLKTRSYGVKNNLLYKKQEYKSEGTQDR